MTINASTQPTRKSTFASNSSTREEESDMNSPKRIARIAGVLYLLVAVFAAFAYTVFTKLYVAGDAVTTAANVVANSGLVRIAVVADLVQATVWVFLALTLYRLLKHVHQSAAGAMVVFVAIGLASSASMPSSSLRVCRSQPAIHMQQPWTPEGRMPWC